MGAAGCVGGQEKDWIGCFLHDLRAFGINADQWTTAAQDEGIAAEKARAGRRHAVACPNVTGRAKERIAQSKQDCASSLTIFD